MVTQQELVEQIEAHLNGDLSQPDLVHWAEDIITNLRKNKSEMPARRVVLEALAYIGAGGTPEIPLSYTIFSRLLERLDTTETTPEASPQPEVREPEEPEVRAEPKKPSPAVEKPPASELRQTVELSDGVDEVTVVQSMPRVQADVVFRPMPHAESTAAADNLPVWRLQFDLIGEQEASFGLDINGEIKFGRVADGQDTIDLTLFDGEKMGVSRRHMLLRPTFTNLHVLDLSSTNGTSLNGQSIGVNTPYRVSSGDVLSIGRLQFVVHIIERPKGETALLRSKADLGDALTEMVKSITSQLDLEEVLGKAVEAAMFLSSASETAVWLVDEQTGELFLEAEQGIEDTDIRRARLPVSDALVGQVIETGKPLPIIREATDESNIDPGHQPESLFYVPIALGGVTFGVLAAAQREAGKQFGERDQRILETIADFAAISVQNSRLYQATDNALTRRAEELTAINKLTHAVSASLEPKDVYEVLAQQVQEHWHVQALSLWILDERTNEVRLAFESGADEASASVTQKMVERTLVSQKPLLLSDLISNGDGDTRIDTQEMRSRSELALPVNLQGKVIGVLDLQSPQLNQFTPTDILTLQTAADQLGVAIQYAHLYKRAYHDTEELERNIAQRTEELKVANTQLHALGRLKDEFVANVSHQLRTPVTNLKLLQDAFVAAPQKKRGDYLEAMGRETNRLERIIDDMLRLARMDQGDFPLNSKLVHLNQIIGRYVTDRMPMAESRKIKLSQSLQADLPTTLVDEELLTQTLSILLSNALNYTPAGGNVLVKTHSRRVAKKLMVGFSISDSGPGIEPEERDLLFERFFRGKVGRDSDMAGTGLGLAIAREIVDLHAGSIEVTNEGIGDRGATFSVWLPLGGIHTANLMLVDDEETMLSVMHDILIAYGHDVRSASSGQIAIDLMHAAADEDFVPDVVITDVVMPRMTGLELLKTVRSNPRWADIPFLFISASTTLAMEGLIAGQQNVTFLRKPFDGERLQETVTAVLQARLEQAKANKPQL